MLGDPLRLLGLDNYMSPEIFALMYTLGLGGLITSTIYYVYGLIWEYIERRLTTSVSVDSSDAIYKWLLQYLIDKNYLAKSMTDAVVKLEVKKSSWWMP